MWWVDGWDVFEMASYHTTLTIYEVSSMYTVYSMQIILSAWNTRMIYYWYGSCIGMVYYHTTPTILKYAMCIL